MSNKTKTTKRKTSKGVSPIPVRKMSATERKAALKWISNNLEYVKGWVSSDWGYAPWGPKAPKEVREIKTSP